MDKTRGAQILTYHDSGRFDMSQSYLIPLMEFPVWAGFWFLNFITQRFRKIDFRFKPEVLVFDFRGTS